VQPYASDPVAFVDPEPVLAVRKPPRRSTGALGASEDPPERRTAAGRPEPRPERPGAEPAEPAEPEPVRFAPVRHEPGQPEPVEPEPVEPEPVEHEPVEHEPADQVPEQRTGEPKIERRSGALFVLKDDVPEE
jgi:fused signal recognition particle receptor